MGNDKQISVALTVTCDPDLLPVLEVVISGLATHLGFGESERHDLQEGVQRASRHLMGSGVTCAGTGMRFSFSGFSDRLEIVVEDGDKFGEDLKKDAVVTRMLDRVDFDEKGNRTRLTLVKYL